MGFFTHDLELANAIRAGRGSESDKADGGGSSHEVTVADSDIVIPAATPHLDGCNKADELEPLPFLITQAVGIPAHLRLGILLL